MSAATVSAKFLAEIVGNDIKSNIGNLIEAAKKNGKDITEEDLMNHIVPALKELEEKLKWRSIKRSLVI